MLQHTSRSLLLVLALASLQALGGCGGGGGGAGDDAGAGGPVETLVVTAPGDLAVAASQFVTGGTPGLSDFFQAGQIAVATAGGSPSDREFRGLVRFPWPNLPAGATVTSATLSTKTFVATASFVSGVGSSSNIGDGLLDHIDAGAALDPADFDSVALQAAFTVFVRPGQLASVTGDVTPVDVTAQVQADVAAGRGQSAFRLHFPLAVVVAAGPHTISLDGTDPGSEPSLTIQFRR